MNQALLEKIQSEQFRKDNANFNVGDSVRVHTKVVEGDKERIQIFSGVVIGKRGRGLNETFTVRRISYGEGVERVFPLHSPRVDKIDVERKGSVRRAKLTYLRKRLGKGATAVKEKEQAAPAAKQPAAPAAREKEPVVALAVVFPERWMVDQLPRPLRGLNDSKQLSEAQRADYFGFLTTQPEVGFGVAACDHATIDCVNILRATYQAMQGALAKLH